MIRSWLKPLSRAEMKSSQDLKQRAGLFVCLSKQTERKGRDGVERPRAVQGHEEILAILRVAANALSAPRHRAYAPLPHLGVERAKSLPEVAEFWRSDHDQVQVLHHDAGEFEILRTKKKVVQRQIAFAETGEERLISTPRTSSVSRISAQVR